MRSVELPMFRASFLVLVCLTVLGSARAQSPVAPFHPLPIDGLENTFAVGRRIYSGAAPESDIGFAALAKLGIQTIISVDGSAPDVVAATRHGIRYIHLPFGYDGIPATNALHLIKAAASVDGPLYIHCHHGKHRGPAAVAVVCEDLEGWSPETATSWMHAAGTATNYTGLYRSAATFRRPTAEELAQVSADFPSRAPTPPLVGTMVQLDGRLEDLKVFRKAGFKTPTDHPDVTGSGAALQLWELLRETQRTKLGVDRGPTFALELGRAEVAAGKLHAGLKDLETRRTRKAESEAEGAFQAVMKQCASCHRAVRD